VEHFLVEVVAVFLLLVLPRGRSLRLTAELS